MVEDGAGASEMVCVIKRIGADRILDLSGGRIFSRSFGFGLFLILGQRSPTARTNLDSNSAAVQGNVMALQIRLPNLIGFALREADVMPELLAFATDVT